MCLPDCGLRSSRSRQTARPIGLQACPRPTRPSILLPVLGEARLPPHRGATRGHFEAGEVTEDAGLLQDWLRRQYADGRLARSPASSNSCSASITSSRRTTRLPTVQVDSHRRFDPREAASTLLTYQRDRTLVHQRRDALAGSKTENALPLTPIAAAARTQRSRSCGTASERSTSDPRDWCATHHHALNVKGRLAFSEWAARSRANNKPEA